MRYACATAKIDITPAEPCALAGYAHRTGGWCHIASRLEANAILLIDGDTRVLFISADILYFGAELSSILEQQAQRFGLPGECLILSASHTHFAPVTERAKPNLGSYDAAFNAILQTKLVQLTNTIMSSSTRAVDVRAGRAVSDANINRRRFWPLPTITRRGLRLRTGIVMAPAPSEPVDRFIDALQFLDQDGAVLCVAWKFACHPVGFPDWNDVSAEFPGQARSRLRKQFGKDLAVVFWQGFAGDVRPRSLARKSWRERIQTIRRGPFFGSMDREAWLAWSDRLAETLMKALRIPESRFLNGRLRTASTTVSLSSMIEGTSRHSLGDRVMRIQEVAFGDDLSLLFLGAEVCSPYLHYFGAGMHRICAGYTGDVFGYLPSAAQAREGGYEGGEYLNLFGLPAPLRAGFQEAVLDAVQSLTPSQPSKH